MHYASAWLLCLHFLRSSQGIGAVNFRLITALSRNLIRTRASYTVLILELHVTQVASQGGLESPMMAMQISRCIDYLYVHLLRSSQGTGAVNVRNVDVAMS
jgi:hypothetical protein